MKLSEKELIEVATLTEKQRRGYKNLRESNLPHRTALALAREER